MTSEDVNPEQAPAGDERDASFILKAWPLDSETVTARRIIGDDGVEQIQLRIPMGLLQLYPEGRPDGARPDGHDSLLAALRDLAERGQAIGKERWYELDREIMQYYHRRIALLALAEQERRHGALEQAAIDYGRVVRDADHNLEIMDFISRHHEDQEFTDTHEQYRGFVLGHRTMGAAMYWLCRGQPEEALNAIQSGLDRLRRVYADRGDQDVMRRDPTAVRLVRLAEQTRKDHSISKTLHEELIEAVAAEDFEKAAQLRDALHRRMASLRPPFKT